MSRISCAVAADRIESGTGGSTGGWSTLVIPAILPTPSAVVPRPARASAVPVAGNRRVGRRERLVDPGRVGRSERDPRVALRAVERVLVVRLLVGQLRADGAAGPGHCATRVARCAGLR